MGNFNQKKPSLKGQIFTFNINAQPDFQILKGLYGSFIEVLRDDILTGFFVCDSM